MIHQRYKIADRCAFEAIVSTMRANFIGGGTRIEYANNPDFVCSLATLYATRFAVLAGCSQASARRVMREMVAAGYLIDRGAYRKGGVLRFTVTRQHFDRLAKSVHEYLLACGYSDTETRQRDPENEKRVLETWDIPSWQ